jgi:hypothetical protein
VTVATPRSSVESRTGDLVIGFLSWHLACEIADLAGEGKCQSLRS